jgi:hypothetical protein
MLTKIIAVFCAQISLHSNRVDFDFCEEYVRVREQMRRYRDRPMSFADACLVRMAELHQVPGSGRSTVTFNFTEKAPQTSFCNSSRHSGTAWMESFLDKVVRAEAANASFTGLAIEDYAGFRTLGP